MAALRKLLSVRGIDIKIAKSGTETAEQIDAENKPASFHCTHPTTTLHDDDRVITAVMRVHKVYIVDTPLLTVLLSSIKWCLSSS